MRIYANEVEILDNDYKVITTHHRSFEKGTRLTHWHDFINVLIKRPRALKYSGFYSLLPETWKSYIKELSNEDMKRALEFLRLCLIDESLVMAEKILQYNLDHDIKDIDALYTTYYRAKEDNQLYEATMTYDELKSMPAYQPDLQSYDILIGGGRS